MLIKFAPASVASALARRVFPVPGGPKSNIPLQGCKRFLQINHTKEKNKINLATVRMHTRNNNHYPQQISMREKLWPSHWKNNEFIKCLFHIFKSTYVIKLHPNFTRRYYSWNEIALKLILCKILLQFHINKININIRQKALNLKVLGK